MIYIIIAQYVLVIISSISNAIMDTVDHHFGKSIFSKIKSSKKRLWWNENQGWRNKYIDRDPDKGRVKMTVLGITFTKPVQITDAWHLFKMIWIVLLISGIALSSGLIIWWMILLDILLMGIVWNSIFSLFYERILIK